MALTTRCPACSTTFRVVPDQLKVSEGWVRCGQCGDVFDATLDLHEQVGGMAPEPLASQPVPPPARAPSPAPADPLFTKPPGAPPANPVAPPPVASTVRPGDDDIDRRMNSVFGDDRWRDSSSGPGPDTGWVAQAAAAPAVMVTEAGNSRIDTDFPPAEPAPRERAPDREAAPDSALDEPGFVRAARRRALWRSPWMRALLVLLNLALLAALAGQFAYRERDRIAALDPRTRPWLEQGCAWLGCQIGPMRQIEAIVIDSSSFTKLKPDTYRVQLTLRSQSPLPLAVPAVELTLTDTQDQAVLRRVLTPAELGASAPVLAASGELPLAAVIAVNAGTRVAGYRVLAFYP